MPISPETRRLLEAHAAQSVELAQRLVSEGETELAVEYVRRSVLPWDRVPSAGALTKSTVTARLRTDMEAAQREKLSKAQTGKKRHPMLEVARKHGMFSAADIARKLGYSKAMMSRIMNKDRAMGETEAATWKRLTGEDWRS